MKRPQEQDFEASASEAGVKVIFKPTSSEYLYHYLADENDIAQHGPVTSAEHAGYASGRTVSDAPAGTPFDGASSPQIPPQSSDLNSAASRSISFDLGTV